MTGALWLYQPDADEWRLIIVSPLVDEKGPRAAYKRLQDVMSKSRTAPPVRLADVSLLKDADPLFHLLATAVQTGVKDIGEIRFRNSVINGVHIEDALLYRIAPSQVGNAAS